MLTVVAVGKVVLLRQHGYEQLVLVEVTACMLSCLKIQTLGTGVTRIVCQPTHLRHSSRGKLQNVQRLNPHRKSGVVDQKIMFSFSKSIVSFAVKHVKSGIQNIQNDGVHIVTVELQTEENYKGHSRKLFLTHVINGMINGETK